MKSTTLGMACVTVGVLVCAGPSSAQDNAAPAVVFRARAGAETSEEAALFWQLVADYCGKEDPKMLDAKIWGPLLDPKVTVHAGQGGLRLLVGKDPSGLLFPIEAQYRFWLAVSPKGAVLVGTPPAKKLIFERHLVQLGSDTCSDPKRKQAKERLAEMLIKKGWERWTVAMLPIEVETGTAADVKCEVNHNEVRITGLGTPLSFTASRLEAALGLGQADSIATPAKKSCAKAQIWLALDWSLGMQGQKKNMCEAMRQVVGKMSAADRERLRVFLVTPQDCWAWPQTDLLRRELSDEAPGAHNGQTIETAAMIVNLARKEPAGVLLGFVSWNPRYSMPDDFEQVWKVVDREQGGRLEQFARGVHFRVLQVLGDTDAVRQVFYRLAQDRCHQYDSWPVELPRPMREEIEGRAKAEANREAKPDAEN